MILGSIGYAVLVCLNQSPGWSHWPYNEWRLLQVGLLSGLILLALWFSTRAGDQQSGLGQRVPMDKTAAWLLSVVAAACLLTAMSRAQPWRAVLEWTHSLILALSTAVLAFAIHRDQRMAAVGSLLIAIAPLPHAVSVLATRVGAAVGTNAIIGNLLGNARYLDDLLLPCLFLAWLSATTLRYAWLPVLVGAVTAIYVVVMLIDGARGNLLAIAVALLFCAWRYRQQRICALGLLGFLSVVAVLYSVASGQYEGAALTRETSSGRLELLRLAWRYVQAEPWMGIGGQAWGHYAPGSSIYDGIERAQVQHPHNLAVQLVVEWGLLGWVMVIWTAAAAWRLLRRIPAAGWGATALLVALIVNFQFSGAHVYPHTQVVYAWSVALVASTVPASEAGLGIARRWHWWWVLPLLAVYASLNVMAFRACDLNRPDDASSNGIDYPRYWQRGQVDCL